MISIDITDTRIKLARAKVSKKKIKITDTVSRTLSPGCVENGYIADLLLLAGEIADMLAGEGIRDKKVILCLNSGVIFSKEILLPKPRAQEPVAVTEAMIANDMGLGDDYNITYTIVDEVIDEGLKKLRLIAMACPQEMVDQYIELCDQLGLKPAQIVIGSNSVNRMVQQSGTFTDKMPLLMAQIDEGFINITLYVENGVSMSRYVKIEAGDYEHSADYINLAVFDNLFRMVHFYSQQHGAEPIKCIQYHGAVANKDAMGKTLKQFNLPYAELTRPQGMSATIELDHVMFASALGAFYPVDPKRENINLINSPALRSKRAARRFTAFAAVFAACCAALVFGLTVYSGLIASYAEASLQALQVEYQNLRHDEVNEEVARKKSAMERFTSFSEKVELARDLFDFQPKMTGDILERLEETLLPGMRVVGSVTVSGYEVSATFECADPKQPNQYMLALEADPYFEGITFGDYTASQNEAGASTYTFTLQMRIKGGNVFAAQER